MKNQALFSSKDKQKLKCHLLQFLFGAFRVNSLLGSASIYVYLYHVPHQR